MVQPHSLLHIIIYHFGQQRYPFCIPYIDKWYPLFVLFIYFATQLMLQRADTEKTQYSLVGLQRKWRLNGLAQDKTKRQAAK